MAPVQKKNYVMVYQPFFGKDGDVEQFADGVANDSIADFQGGEPSCRVISVTPFILPDSHIGVCVLFEEDAAS